MRFKKGLLSRTRFPEANCPKKQFSHKSGEGPRMWTVLSQHCQLFLEPFGKDLFGSFPGSCGTFPGSCGSTRFGLAVFCFFSWMMWHFSWIIWLYLVWPCNFLLLFLDDVALFLDHLALLNLALQFYILAASCWPDDLFVNASHNVYRHVLNVYKHLYIYRYI